MTLKEIESATKRNILNRIKEAVEANDYTITNDGTDDSIIIDGITIVLWKTAYYVKNDMSFTISLRPVYEYITDEDREIHKKLFGIGDADRIKRNIEKKEMEIAELRKTLEKVTATA